MDFELAKEKFEKMRPLFSNDYVEALKSLEKIKKKSLLSDFREAEKRHFVFLVSKM